MKNVRRLTRRDFLKDAAKTAAVVAVSGVLPPIIGCGSDVAYDTLIRGGEVHDGMGNAPRIADIGIIGDRIVAIGNLTGGGVRTIEAQGLLVCPGFIDVHTHVDITLLYLEPIDVFPIDLTGNFNYMYQGVTTVVAGNCGAGYTDIEGFFDKLHKSGGYGTNICSLAPHGLIREDLFKDEQPQPGMNQEQLDKMKAAIAVQMEKGTIGFSVGLEYANGCFSNIEELIEIAKVVKSYDGLYATHTRDQTGTGLGLPPENLGGVLKSIDEAIQIGQAADIPVQVSHLQVVKPWNDVAAHQILERIETARQEGLDITGDIHVSDIGISNLNYRLPIEIKSLWGVKKEYQTPEGRKTVQTEIEKVFKYLGPDEIQTCSVPWKPDKSYDLQYLIDLPGLPGNDGKTPSECYVDLVADPDHMSPDAYHYEINPDVRDGIIPHDHIFMASDGYGSSEDPDRTAVVHPRSFFNFTKVLTEFVIKNRLMDLPFAIRKMTSLPADKFKLKDRGRIEEGYFADIVVIDTKKLASHATIEDARHYSTGVEYSLVNGVLAIENGTATDQRAGKILRMSKGSVV